METPFLSRRTCSLLFFLLGIVYIAGLFVPLMDNDSAHHADIALHMYLTGDYVSLVDNGKDYLDKPHLLFWLSACCYKVFGVTGFAYKLPSFLFSILGVYSTYRLAAKLHDRETGKLAALVLASSFAFILANNDVRMDAILTSSIAFATWQLVEFIRDKRWMNMTGSALGLALGFCTKGHIAVFVPAVSALFYILWLRDWKLFLNPKWLVILVLFGLFISPVVYCYYLQFNLHPEKTVRGKDHINGIRFILFNQSVERFQGDSFGGDAKNDYFFFLHSFLWAFAPWSILAYIAVIIRIKRFVKRTEEWLTTGTFLTILLVVSLSGFKLPHYLNIVFPVTAVLTSYFIINRELDTRWSLPLYRIQLITTLLLLAGIAALTLWAFPVKKLWVIAMTILFLSVYFYFIRTRELNKVQQAVCISVSAMALVFFLLNANFYPQLLKYQGGNMLAAATKNKLNPDRVYYWDKNISSSYSFYTSTLRKPFVDSVLIPGEKTWVLYDIRNEGEIVRAGYSLGNKFSTPDFEITRLDLKFINPATRDDHCTEMVIAEISR